MKTVFLSVIFLFWVLFPSPGFAAESDDILGQWITEDRDSRIEIFKKDHLFFGKIAALKFPSYLPGEVNGMDGKPRLDSSNQDESLRSREMVGIELMKNFRFDSGKWVGGSIYDPKNGKTYKCEMSLAADGSLLVRGYVGVSLFGRTTVWEPASVYLEKELDFLGLTGCACD